MKPECNEWNKRISTREWPSEHAGMHYCPDAFLCHNQGQLKVHIGSSHLEEILVGI